MHRTRRQRRKEIIARARIARAGDKQTKEEKKKKKKRRRKKNARKFDSLDREARNTLT